MFNKAGEALSVQMEVVDGNGLLPMRHTDKVYPAAYTFRRYIQTNLPQFLYHWPQPDPLGEVRQPRLTGTRSERLVASGVPQSTLKQWRPAFEIGAQTSEVALGDLPYRCQVPAVGLRGE